VPRVAAGPDEVVEGQPERLAQCREGGGVAVDKILRGYAFRLRGQHVLQRVVVGTGEEAHRFAALATMSGQYVGLDQLQHEPEMGPGIDVRDGGGHVERHRNLSSQKGLRIRQTRRGPVTGPRISSSVDGPG